MTCRLNKFGITAAASNSCLHAYDSGKSTRIGESEHRMRRGTNLPMMGDFNQSVILDAVRRAADGLSRVEIVEAVSLSPQAVSSITRRLLNAGLIVEAGKTSIGPGKPRTTLRINPTSRYALGVHLDPAVMTLVLMDLMGSVVGRRTLSVQRQSGPDGIIAAIAHEVNALIDSSEIEKERIEGIGLATPGPIDQQAGTVVDPPHLIGWHRVPLREKVKEATGLPVSVEKDVIASAVAEIWAGGRNGTRSFIFIYIGTGTGGGLVINGDVVRGVSGNAGEIGHIVTDPAGPLCWCGLHGCVAVTCTPESLVTQARQVGALTANRGRQGEETIEAFLQLCSMAASGHAVAAEILDTAARRMARAVAVVANALDVDSVVFGGPFWEPVRHRYLEVLPAALLQLQATRTIHPIEVSATEVGEDVAAVGAACLVLEHRLGPRAERLLLNT